MFWSQVENGFIKKILLISKHLTSQPGKQIITINVFPNISRSKVSQFIKYNMRDIFFENH